MAIIIMIIVVLIMIIGFVCFGICGIITRAGELLEVRGGANAPGTLSIRRIIVIVEVAFGWKKNWFVELERYQLIQKKNKTEGTGSRRSHPILGAILKEDIPCMGEESNLAERKRGTFASRSKQYSID